jgi:hypothetical protein
MPAGDSLLLGAVVWRSCKPLAMKVGGRKEVHPIQHVMSIRTQLEGRWLLMRHNSLHMQFDSAWPDKCNRLASLPISSDLVRLQIDMRMLRKAQPPAPFGMLTSQDSGAPPVRTAGMAEQAAADKHLKCRRAMHR